MPTKKPRIQALMEIEDYKKFQELCKIKDRTESKLAAIIIKEYLQSYETQHGEIRLDDSDQGGGKT